MSKKTIWLACAAAWLGAFGAPTMGVVDGKYVIDVPTGETYTLTADDVFLHFFHRALCPTPYRRESRG